MTASIDPVTFAVLKSAFESIVDDMAYTVMRTARSPIVRDVLDYSTTMCDAQGRILAQAKTVALHLGAVPDAMAALQRHFADDLNPGDVIVFNDPYDGGMHLPDIFMFKPIFSGPRHVGFSVVICHHCDVGGRVPGSNASDSTEIFQEGLRIPPLKLFSEGVRNDTLFDIISKNVRLPDLVLGDLDAQLATCNLGERELLRLVYKYGADMLEDFLAEFLDYGERLTRRAIAEWPDGSYSFTDTLVRNGQYAGMQIPNVPRHRASVRTVVGVGAGVTVGIEGIFVGERFFESDYENTFGMVESYFLLNTRVKLTEERFTVFLDVSNLLDQEYAEYGVLFLGFPFQRAFLPSPGINASVGVSFTF